MMSNNHGTVLTGQRQIQPITFEGTNLFQACKMKDAKGLSVVALGAILMASPGHSEFYCPKENTCLMKESLKSLYLAMKSCNGPPAQSLNTVNCQWFFVMRIMSHRNYVLLCQNQTQPLQEREKMRDPGIYLRTTLSHLGNLISTTFGTLTMS